MYLINLNIQQIYTIVFLPYGVNLYTYSNIQDPPLLFTLFPSSGISINCTLRAQGDVYVTWQSITQLCVIMILDQTVHSVCVISSTEALEVSP